MIGVPTAVRIIAALALTAVQAVVPTGTFMIFDAPDGAEPGSLWDGYICEVYQPIAAGTEPPMEFGTIVFDEVYGPWKDVRCDTPRPVPGRLIWGCVRAIWDDGMGGFVFSECVTQEDYSAEAALRSAHPRPPETEPLP